jgi:biotin transport system substrate-specific component
MSFTSPVLANKLWPQTSTNSLVRNLALAVVGSLLVAGAAQITVPMWPVPMTLQTLAVLGVGAAFGARLGAASLALYAIEGLIGLPFFAGGKHGLFNADGTILASGGFIIGFILAAWLVGRLVENGWGNSVTKTMLAALIGGAVLYVKTQGVAAAAAIPTAFDWGMKSFIFGDIIKAVVAGFAVSGAVKTTAK